MNKKKPVSAPKKTNRPSKQPLVRKAVAKKVIPVKTRTYNHWFIIFTLTGVVLVTILLLLMRINLYYDNIQTAISQQSAVDQSAFANQLPSSSAAADPTVSGRFNDGKKQPFWTQEDAYLGNLRGVVRIFYFADYNSAASRDQEKNLEKLAAAYPQQIFLVHKDFPSDNPISQQSARAVRCAQEQNSFWKYNDLLLAYLNQEAPVVKDVLYDKDAPSKSNQLQESRTFLANIASQAGLNQEAFNQCLANASSPIVAGNISEGDSLGISAVPTIFINGQEFANPLSYQDLERLVKVVLNK